MKFASHAVPVGDKWGFAILESSRKFASVDEVFQLAFSAVFVGLALSSVSPTHTHALFLNLDGLKGQFIIHKLLKPLSFCGAGF